MERLSGGTHIKDKGFDVDYSGLPIKIVAGRHSLEVGKAKDLEIRYPNPEAFLVIDKDRFATTHATQGFIALRDGNSNALFFGRSVDHGFGFTFEDERFHFAVKRNGETITVRDMGTEKGTTILVPFAKPAQKAS